MGISLPLILALLLEIPSPHETHTLPPVFGIPPPLDNIAVSVRQSCPYYNTLMISSICALNSFSCATIFSILAFSSAISTFSRVSSCST